MKPSRTQISWRITSTLTRTGRTQRTYITVTTPNYHNIVVVLSLTYVISQTSIVVLRSCYLINNYAQSVLKIRLVLAKKAYSHQLIFLKGMKNQNKILPKIIVKKVSTIKNQLHRWHYCYRRKTAWMNSNSWRSSIRKGKNKTLSLGNRGWRPLIKDARPSQAQICHTRKIMQCTVRRKNKIKFEMWHLTGRENRKETPLSLENSVFTSRIKWIASRNPNQNQKRDKNRNLNRKKNRIRKFIDWVKAVEI